MHTREENEFMTRTGPARRWASCSAASGCRSPLRGAARPGLHPGPRQGPQRRPHRLPRHATAASAWSTPYCPHRGAPLFFGRNEEDGLRCVYHGWKFDVDGACVDMPNAPEGDRFKTRSTSSATPASRPAAWSSPTWAPGSTRRPPWLRLGQSAGDHVYVRKYLDRLQLPAVPGKRIRHPGHSAFLHSSLNPATSQSQRIIAQNEAARGLITASMARGRLGNFDIYDTEYGSASARRLEDGRLALSSHFILPSFSTAGAVSAPNTNPLNLKVPIDDENTVFFRLKWSPEALKPEVVNVYKHANHEFPDQVPGCSSPPPTRATTTTSTATCSATSTSPA